MAVITLQSYKLHFSELEPSNIFQFNLMVRGMISVIYTVGYWLRAIERNFRLRNSDNDAQLWFNLALFDC